MGSEFGLGLLGGNPLCNVAHYRKNLPYMPLIKQAVAHRAPPLPLVSHVRTAEPTCEIARMCPSSRRLFEHAFFVPVAPYATYILPTYVGVAMILFILVVLRYSDRV